MLMRESFTVSEFSDELFAIFMNCPMGICLFEGEDHRYTLMNPAYAKLFNHTHAVIGCTLRQVMNDLEQDILMTDFFADAKFYTILDNVYRTGQIFNASDVSLQLKQAEQTIQFYLDVNCQPKLNKNKQIEGIIVIINDITAQSLARKKIEDGEKELRDALAARDEFLSVASHELKTPITSLKLQIQIAKRKLTSPKQLTFPREKMLAMLDTSVQQIDRLTQLVDDLLDITKIRAGKFILNLTPTYIKSLIENIIKRFSGELETKGMTVTMNIPSDMVGLWDSMRIEQVIVNLLSNAIKYAPGSPVAIAAKQKNNYVELSVQDAGPGIPKRQQNVIFKRFERAASKKSISGLGLGLFIVKKIVENHNGVIGVKSKEGKGTTFIIKLPIDAREKIVQA